MTTPNPGKKLIKGGLFLVHEGGEGAGKSSQATGLQAKLDALGYDTVVTREPGATELGQRLRRILIDPGLSGGGIDGYESLFMFSADRHAHVRQVIRPALEAGKIVICDRYIFSTQVYQQIEKVEPAAIAILARLSTAGLLPARTYWLDVTPVIGLARLTAEGRTEVNKNDTRQLEFHNQVRAGFQNLWRLHPDQIVRINADQPAEKVLDDLYLDIRSLIRSGARPNLPTNP